MIEDATGFPVCFLYFEDEKSRPDVSHRMNRKQAERIARQLGLELSSSGPRQRRTRLGCLAESNCGLRRRPRSRPHNQADVPAATGGVAKARRQIVMHRRMIEAQLPAERVQVEHIVVPAVIAPGGGRNVVGDQSLDRIDRHALSEAQSGCFLAHSMMGSVSTRRRD